MARPEPPAPRSGVLGLTDEFIGPGATKAEILLQTLPLIPASGLAYLYASRNGLSVVHSVGAALFAADLLGGVVTNSTSAAKRWYHRSSQGVAQHLCFVAVHAIHVAVVAYFYRNADLAWGLAVFAYLVTTATTIVHAPRYLQRPIAHLLYTAALAANTTSACFKPTKGLQWFIPVFHLKLLVAHLVDEQPFPAEENSETEPLGP